MHISKIFSLILLMLLISSCEEAKYYSWNYRITIEVETPEGIKSGSAVRRVAAQLGNLNPFYDARDYVQETYGEAVVVDLGERGILFALINQESNMDVYDAIASTHKDPSFEQFYYYDTLASGTRGILKRSNSTLTTFDDLDDPKTVKELNYDDLESAFGQGVKINQILIEIIDDPVSRGTVDKYISSDFKDKIHEWKNSADLKDYCELEHLFKFKEYGGKSPLYRCKELQPPR